MTDQQQELIIKMALDSWNTQLYSRADKTFNALSDEQLQQEVAPGRNTGVYLLGHLAVVHDALLPLLGIGEKLHPELENVFLKSPDKSGLEKPSVQDLRNYWNEINKKLTERLDEFSTSEWFQRHTAVSDEDFEKEPHRNRLNVIMGRTNHLAYHLGQIAFLKK